jgi:TolB-like protein/tetratricopeptide (TPR) repeat protein
MPDVFLSYSREDQPVARRFAEALEREGFRVWWDQALNAGEAFDRVTEKALEEAKAVVVLWSKHSVDSDWVRAEATQARASRRLVPVMIEPCKRPVMFELTHTADLEGWSGDSADPRWRSLTDGLRRFIGRERENSGPANEAVAPVANNGGARQRKLAIGIMAALLIGTGLLWTLLNRDEPPEPALAPVPATSSPAASATQPAVTLAVLPFANLSADPAQEYFSDGLTEEILNQLAQIPALRLTGRTSSFSFKGKNEDLRVIGEKLGVAHLLEGSVRKDGNQLRVTAQLIRADDGTHEWSKTYDRGLSNVFAVQDEIAEDVAQALSVKLDVTTLNRALGGTTNVEAYDRYLQWRTLALSERSEPEVVRRMVELLREAVALDPGFVLAWDELAGVLTSQSSRVGEAQAEQLRAEAADARNRVAALAPYSWMVKREQAYALWAEGKWAEALSLTESIMRSGPLTWEHAYPHSNLLFAVGRVEETVELINRLKAIEPLAMFMSRDQQWNLTAAGRFDEAEAEYQRSKTLDGSRAQPTQIAFLRMLAREDADPQALRVLHRELMKELGERARPYHREIGERLNDRSAMREILKRDFEARQNPSVRHYADALGDADLALAAMRSMWKGRSPSYEDYWELWLTPYSGMRSLPGFKELMREVGLVDYWRQTGDWGDVCRPVGDDDFECR